METCGGAEGTRMQRDRQARSHGPCVEFLRSSTEEHNPSYLGGLNLSVFVIVLRAVHKAVRFRVSIYAASNTFVVASF